MRCLAVKRSLREPSGDSATTPATTLAPTVGAGPQSARQLSGETGRHEARIGDDPASFASTRMEESMSSVSMNDRSLVSFSVAVRQ